ncbi:hypothetical protein JAAARDRAFT_169262 [Jaapia argillacea MUCL 33604]|uniref:UBC core domain-containing protein n=1 Tax=Jaapia argillacea MUCL 33604 TaxID=933084 RepID=A0A067QIY0_9AGAM|nr:hypothetical protein JAAARDRAFT_169262 [Jaapia argillacea MUCL 33604]
MAPHDHKHGPTKFYQEDIVRRISHPNQHGVVLRCWHDAEDIPLPLSHSDPLMRPLEPGEVGVSFFPKSIRQIMPEIQLELMDRTFHVGDLAKRAVEEVKSGVVCGVKVECRLEHAISGEKLEGWWDGGSLTEEGLMLRTDVDIGDYVEYDDWIGQIVEMFDEALVETGSGELVKVADLRWPFAVGDKGKDILQPNMEGMNLFNLLSGGQFLSSRSASADDTVVYLKHTVLAICWLAINQSLSSSEAHKRQRPEKLWFGSNLSKLKLYRTRSEQTPRISDRVQFTPTNPTPLTDASTPNSASTYPPFSIAASASIPFTSSRLSPLSVPSTKHGRPTDPTHGQIEVRTFTVCETRSTVDLLWQDGQREWVNSSELIPYMNPDEYDCWPGDQVIHKTEDHNRPGIVQRVNPTDRTALIRYHSPSVSSSSPPQLELVSVLELDPHGTSDWSALLPTPDGLGVRRGDMVFIHAPGTTNGLTIPVVPPADSASPDNHQLSHNTDHPIPPVGEIPSESTDKSLRVPRIGEIEEWVRELPFDQRGVLNGWRRQMVDLGSELAQRKLRGGASGQCDGEVVRPKKGDEGFDWYGEVSDLRLDGTVEVTLPNATTTIVPLSRLTRLYDGLEQLEDLFDEMSEKLSGEYDDDSLSNGSGKPHWSGSEDEEMWATDEHGNWQPQGEEDEDEWEDESGEEASGMEMTIVNAMDVDVKEVDLGEIVGGHGNHYDAGTPMEISPPPTVGPTSGTATPQAQIPGLSAATAAFDSHRPMSPDVPKDVIVDPDEILTSLESKKNADEDHGADEYWKRFDIVAQAPVDHAFYASPPAQPSRNFLARLTKEYRVLSSSLPDSIIVRAYEDRTDLLRCLIIGPENTPYQDAPFVIDWMLDSNFPNSPPIAHFLSWTNGNGRVNPNLYEEGKVCLSILGTWAGDRNETWSAARSSLLQVLVSIQALVLVKEPWFCEPAYEKLRGTEEGIVNSRLYSEKAFVLSRGFVRRALEIPLGSLESEIHWLYYKSDRLAKVLQDSRALIAKSKAMPEDALVDGELAVPRLTAGGIIMLERTLHKLQALLDAHIPAPIDSQQR